MSSGNKELWQLTAREAVDLLAKGDVSPIDMIDAAEARIEAVEPTINALPILCLDRARLKAREMMERPRSAGGRGQLHGLPIVVKDLTPVEGVRWTDGSRVHEGRIADHSDLAVRKLEENGAIVIGKSNTPEFGAGGNTTNDVFGATRNPWNTAFTSGGSSGGSAVALATGQAWLATGSDMAGSIRIPAAFCSVVGLRPSPGRIPHGPKPLPFSLLNVDGPMARTVGDTALMFDAMIGEDLRDPLALPLPDKPFLDAVDAPRAPKRIAWSADLGLAPVDAEVAAICRKALGQFEALGAVVEDACPDLGGADHGFQTLRNLQRASGGALISKHEAVLGHEIVHYTRKGQAMTGEGIANAELARGRAYHAMHAFFGRYDILATPTVLSKPIDIGTKHLMEFQGKSFDDYFGWLVLTYAITLTACPAISVPCGFTSDGFPVGLQLVARLRGEAELLSAAAVLEQGLQLAKMVPIDPQAGSI